MLPPANGRHSFISMVTCNRNIILFIVQIYDIMLQGYIAVVVACWCCCILTICYKINDQANIRKFMIVAGNITASPDSLGRALRWAAQESGIAGGQTPLEATTHGFGERFCLRRWRVSTVAIFHFPGSTRSLSRLSSLLSIRCDSNPIQYTMAEECPCKWKLLGN